MKLAQGIGSSFDDFLAEVDAISIKRVIAFLPFARRNTIKQINRTLNMRKVLFNNTSRFFVLRPTKFTNQ